ncbi:MAG: hypothetical protein ACR2QH_03975 [Geminicoccaceae bacterium]
MPENALMRQLAQRRELMAELVRLDNPQADLDQYRIELLQRASFRDRYCQGLAALS